jgi:hypothetical protein
MFVNAATALLRFLLTLLVLTVFVLLTLHTRMAWVGYFAIIFGAVVLFALGTLIGFSVRRLR